MRTHHTQLACPKHSEDLSRSFYTGILGLTEIEKPAALRSRGGVWFRHPDGNLEIHLGVQDPFTPASKAHPGIGLDTLAQLEALAHSLAAAQVPLTWSDELLDVPSRYDGRTVAGFHRFHTQDPHGNRLEFLAPIADPS